MDTTAAPTPASPPAQPVNGTVRLEVDFSEVQDALTFEQVTDLVAQFAEAVRTAVRPIRGVHCSAAICGSVHSASASAPVPWELALLYRTAQAKAMALRDGAAADA